MNYMEELKKAKENNINIYKLVIANEVEDFLSSFETPKNDIEYSMLFEELCSVVSMVYLKLDNSYSLSNVVESVCRLHFEKGVELEEIYYIQVVDFIYDYL